MKLSIFVVLIVGVLARAALASDLSSQPPNLVVPANLPDPSSLPAATQKAVEESFETVRRQLALALPKGPAPVLPAQLPLPPRAPASAPNFSAETLAKIEESFSPFYLRNGNMGSLTELSATFGGRETEQLADKLSTEISMPNVAAAPEVAPVLAQEVKQAIKNRFAGLADDPLDPQSDLGRVFAEAGRSGSQGQAEDESIFQRVHARYSARAKELSLPVNLAGQP